MKKLVNKVEDVVKESLQGMAAAHPDLLKVYFEPNFIVRQDAPVQGKVALVSGGGSGHEPLHGGFVGRGMLTGACPGEVFTSPTPDQIQACTEAVDGGAGVLHIVKNYTGDVLNFEMARDLCSKLRVEAVVMNDDVAVQDSTFTTGRRGVGTTVLAEKICGAAAEAGADLDSVKALCEQVNAQGRSLGVALSSCTVPAAGKPTFELGADEIEFGIGIHGEPGRERIKQLTATELTQKMLAALLPDLGLGGGEDLLVMVNGMGGTPLVELYIIYNELSKILASKDIRVVGKLVGNYITSLEMQGCSITLLKTNQSMLKYWLAPVHTPALRWGV